MTVACYVTTRSHINTATSDWEGRLVKTKIFLIDQKSSSSDYYNDIRYENQDTIRQNENEPANNPSAGIPNTCEKEMIKMQPGGAYDWKKYHEAISDVMSTCSSVVEVENTKTKRISCFDSLMKNNKVDSKKYTCCWDESLEKIKEN